MICQHILFPLLDKRQGRSLPNFLEKAAGEAGQLTKWVVSIIVRCLRMNKIISKWNRTNDTDIGNATNTHKSRVKIQSRGRMETMWSNTSAFLEIFKELIGNHYVPTRIILRMWWWYLQISRRRWNNLNFMRASWSWYRYTSTSFF